MEAFLLSASLGGFTSFLEVLSIRGELAVIPFSSSFIGRKWTPRDKEIIIYETNFKLILLFKGSDWLGKVVELSMQCCRKLLSDSFETY